MRQNERKEGAVSPVVGVMLMLVVTIIIAAVVSAFAGGLGQNSPKAPQVSISAETHNSSYIILDHKGGDSISGSAITIKTYIPSGTYKDMSYQVNLSNVTYLPDGGVLSNAKTIQPGDKIRIDWADAFYYSCYPGYGCSYYAPGVGEPVDINIYDSASGKEIATTRATVMP